MQMVDNFQVHGDAGDCRAAAGVVPGRAMAPTLRLICSCPADALQLSCHYSSKAVQDYYAMPHSTESSGACFQAVIIITMLPNQAIASTPSAPRPSGAEGRGSTAPLCLQLLRTSHYVSRL
jgi:hypothetical protein